MDPVIYKELVVAHAGMNFVNGDTEFDFPVGDMDEMVKNFTAHPRQVPVYLGGEHQLGSDHADRPADGWVEGIKRVGVDLIARVKLIGEAAIAVSRDTFRNVSIGAYQPPDLHGNDVGWRLDHLLITNAGFYSDTNIAARAARSGKPKLLYLTASKEAAMADDPKKKDDPAPKADPKKDDIIDPANEVETLTMRVQEQNQTIRELSDKNDLLAEELKERQKNGDLETALKENRTLTLRLDATKIRELVALGIDRGQFKRDLVKGYEGGDDRSDALTLSWFKTSLFEGEMGKLTFALKTFPKTAMRRSFVSGDPGDEEATALQAEEAKAVEAAGKDPKIFAATRGAKNFTDYKRRKDAAAKG